MKMKKLTRREFARAIRYGQGRAFLHVKKHGDKGIEYEILHACLNDLVYDGQFENCRAGWLARILDQTERIEDYVSAILKALADSPEDGSSYVQMAALAGELFDRGFSECKDVLFNLPSVVHNRDERLDVCGALVRTACMSGLRKAIHMMPDADDWLIYALYERTIAQLDDDYGVDSFLNENKDDDPLIEKFYKTVQKEKADRATTEKKNAGTTRPDLTLAEVLSLIEADALAEKRPQRFVLSRFGKNASNEDLECILERMDKDENPLRLRGYLSVFERRQLPRVSKRILEFTVSGDMTLRTSASEALSIVKSAKVRKTALAVLNQGSDEDTVIALTLLKRNYRSADQEAVLSALKRIKSDDGRHSAGLDVLNLVDDCGDTAITDLILWVCENTPCGGCRASALRALAKIGATTEALMHEAQWDACDSAAATARAAYGLP